VEAEPPISSSDSENRNSTANTVWGHIPLEPGASPTNNASGLERGWEQDFIWSKEPKGQKEENIKGPRQKGRPGDQGRDYGSSTFMVGMDHSKLSSNPSKQTASEGDLVDGANRAGSEKARTGKVVNTLSFTLDAC
jgi:hypothetical protein